MDNTGLLCLICGKIFDYGDSIFSYNVCVEKKGEDDVYDVVGNAECLFLSCRECLRDKSISSELTDMEDHLIAKLKPEVQSQSQDSTEVESRYDCGICGQPIPDGDQMFTTNHCIENHFEDRIEPELNLYHLTSCMSCHKKTKLDALLNEGINTLITRHKTNG